MKVDMTGYRTGRLEVKEYAGKTEKRKSSWKCECECGNICFHTTTELRALEIGSCGCLQKEIAAELVRKAQKNVKYRGGRNGKEYNKTVSKANTSGIRGVSYHKRSGKWRVQIKYNGKQLYLGLFENLEDAAKARAAAEQKIMEGYYD